MTESFKGALYINGSNNSVPIRATFEFDSMRFLLENGSFFEANYNMIKISLGGFENRLIELKAVSKDNNAIICYISQEDVKAFLEACSRPGVNLDRAQLSNIAHIFRTDRTLEFFFNWGIYILGIIVLAVIGFIYFFPLIAK